MPLTVKVNGAMNGLVHKGSNHIANSTAPDVCKTPSPGGPVPVPYPVIVSQSGDLANGTTTVKVDGQMAAVKDCEFSLCTGDEPGTAGRPADRRTARLDGHSCSPGSPRADLHSPR